MFTSMESYKEFVVESWIRYWNYIFRAWSKPMFESMFDILAAMTASCNTVMYPEQK